MDISAIIDTDTSNSKPSPSQKLDTKGGYQQSHPSLSYASQSPAHKRPRSKRPPQPPPLQPPIQPLYNVLRSPGSSQNSVSSPYQQTPSSALSGGNYGFLPPLSTQGLTHNFPTSPNSQRENHLASKSMSYQPYGQPSSTSQTPTVTTPINYHHVYPRQGSSHSLSNPPSAQTQSPSTYKDSPQSSQSQMRISSQSASSQQHLSQPGTPLGPPPMISRQAISFSRDSPGSYDNQRNNSMGLYNNQQMRASSPRTDSLAYSSTSPLASAPPQSFSQAQSYHNKHERGRSPSVSPKTLFGDMNIRRPGVESMTHSVDYGLPVSGDTFVMSTNHSLHINVPTYSIQRGSCDDQPEIPPAQEHKAIESPIRSRSLGVKGILNSPNVNESTVAQESPRTKKRKFSASDKGSDHASVILESHVLQSILPPSTEPSNEKPSSNQSLLHSPSSQSLATQDFAPEPPLKTQATRVISSSPPPSVAKMKSPSPSVADATEQETADKQSLDALASSDDRPIEAPKKRRRNDPLPIYARSARKEMPTKKQHNQSAGSQPALARQEPALARQEPALARQEPASIGPGTSSPEQLGSSTAKNSKAGTNGHLNPTGESNISTFTKPADTGPLGDWEENILNTRPSEESVKAIMDFLYREVVGRPEVGVGPAGGGSSKGAMMEIEAKIGQLIDKNTNERLRLPILTESVLNRDDPVLRVNFKSSMTETQHRSLNGFLNQALLASQPAKGPSTAKPLSKPRIPMSYVHTYECDTFFELSQAGVLGLPTSIRTLLNPRHSQVKVRITTDQKTGKVLAKIVKVRIADLDIYSPRTAFDWRVSINLEMNFDGDMNELVEPQARNGRRAERNKDRMSYKHLAYQIDLTQVTTAEATSKTDKEHELEIEVSAAELRKHGTLLRENQPNDFERLVLGFVNNVRVLVRQCA